MGVEDIANGGLHVVRALIPPRDSDPHKHKWAWTVTIALWSIMSGGIFHIAWVCGFLTVVGLPQPYADAAQVQSYGDKIVLIQSMQLNSDIREAKRQVCLAIQAKNQTALDAWARELEGLKDFYRRNIHQEPQVMGCDELLIGGTQG